MSLKITRADDPITMAALMPIGRIGSRNIYLAPDGRTGMRRDEANAAHRKMAQMKADLDAEVSYSMATGFGDHAKIARLDHAVAQMAGRS